MDRYTIKSNEFVVYIL